MSTTSLFLESKKARKSGSFAILNTLSMLRFPLPAYILPAKGKLAFHLLLFSGESWLTTGLEVSSQYCIFIIDKNNKISN